MEFLFSSSMGSAALSVPLPLEPCVLPPRHPGLSPSYFHYVSLFLLIFFLSLAVIVAVSSFQAGADTVFYEYAAIFFFTFSPGQELDFLCVRTIARQGLNLLWFFPGFP